MSRPTCTAFSSMRIIATGETFVVALAVQAELAKNPEASILVFDNDSSETLELDLRGSPDDLKQRLSPPPAPPTPVGRPKLGVVAKEVTLLPRHWDWLAQQPGGASVALRKLVEEARRVNATADEIRRRQAVTYKFMASIAGDLPGFEEASRALFANNAEAFSHQIREWPTDVRTHALNLFGGTIATQPVP